MKSIVLIAAMLTGAAAILPGAANAQVGFTLEVGTPPPPAPLYEAPPPQRYGYEWVPGFWDWNGREYVWVQGYWVAAREGYYFDAPTWIIIDNRWHLNRGGWRPGRPPPRYIDHGRHYGNPPRHDDRHDDHRGHGGDHNGNNWGYRAPAPRQGDRDHDGIPNRVDRDRDGDGTPNRFDRQPDNSHRR